MYFSVEGTIKMPNGRGRRTAESSNYSAGGVARRQQVGQVDGCVRLSDGLAGDSREEPSR